MASDQEKTISMEEGSNVANNATGDSEAIPAGLTDDPKLLARLGNLLSGENFLAALPPEVKRRIKSLKKLTLEQVKLEAKYFEEMHELECKYENLYKPLFEKRRDIVSGQVEPTDSDCEWPSDEEEEEEEGEEAQKLADTLKSKVDISQPAEPNTEATPVVDGENKAPEANTAATSSLSGIPKFWLTIFKQTDLLSDMIQEHDEPILDFLQDVTCVYDKDPPGFTLEFHFAQNPHFTNSILTKQYRLRFDPELDHHDRVLAYDGPEIIECHGCPIDWGSGKNVTLKIVKKKQKHKSRGSTRTVTKTVKNDSFFNFFDPPNVAGINEEDIDEETEELLAADYEIGHYFRERIIPRAVLYFTGEALEEDESEDERSAAHDDEEEEEEEGDDDEDESDDDYIESRGRGGKKGASRGGGDKHGGQGQAGNDCKQQ